MATKTKTEVVLELPVAYSNVSIGDKTARVGVTVSRGNLTVSQADKNLVGRRLVGTIMARAGKAQADQDSLPGLDADVRLKGSFDVKGIGVGPKSITAGLTFPLDGLDIEKLAHFAKREGVLTITDVADIPEGDESGDDE